MDLEVLLSCMFEKGFSIINRSNLASSKVLVINQTNIEKELIETKNNCTMISCNERGLSKSRNKALNYATGDICLISDNDEYFDKDFEQKIKNAYQSNPEADIIIFQLEGLNKKLGSVERKMKKLDLFRVSSQQISFKRESIIKNNLKFDELLGAGTNNGGGEENKFLLDAFKKHLNIYFIPENIAKLNEQNTSTWFHGYNKKYFYDWGKTIRYIMGGAFAFFYGFYVAFTKRKLYKKEISTFLVLKYFFKGIFSKKIKETTNE